MKQLPHALGALARSPRARLALDFAVYAAIVAYAVLRTHGGLNPQSLWYSDAWVGLIKFADSPEQFLLLNSTSPVLYSLAQRILLAVVPDPEIAVQVVAYGAYLALIPACGLVTHAVTGLRGAGYLAAAMLAANLHLAKYSAAAKQYTLDALVTVVLLGAFWRLTGGSGGRRWGFAAFLLLGGVLFFASYISIAMSFAAIGAYLLTELGRGARERGYAAALLSMRRDLAFLAAYLGIVLAIYFLIQPPSGHTALDAYWRPYFPDPRKGAWGAIAFTAHRLWDQVLWPFQPSFGVPAAIYAALALLGVVWVGKARRAALSLYAAFSVLGLAMLQALSIYPLGALRVSIYWIPFAAILTSAGAAALLSATPRAAGTAVCLALAAAMLRPAPIKVMAAQRDSSASEIVERIEARRAPGEAILIHPMAIMQYAFYTRYPVRIVRDHTHGTGFLPVIHAPDIIAMPRGLNHRTRRDYRHSPRALARWFAENRHLFDRYERVHLMVAHGKTKSTAQIAEELKTMGFAERKLVVETSASYSLFERSQ